MSERPQSKGSKHGHFWRACRYLAPYRSKVIISICAAFFVGFAMAGGLTTMIPIMRVMISGDTMQGWIYRQAAERRLGVNFDADPTVVQITKVNTAAARDAGIAPLDLITAATPPANAPPSPFPLVSGDPLRWTPRDQAYHAGEIFRRIAWTLPPAGQPAAATHVQLTIAGRSLEAPLAPPKWYDPILFSVVEHMPVRAIKAVAVVFAVLACIALIGNVLRFFQEHYSDQAAILAANDIRQRLYDRVLRLPMASLGGQGASDVTSRLITDVDNLQDGFKTVLGQSIQEPIKAFFAFLLALRLSWVLTLFIVLLAPIMGIMMRKFGKKMRRASRAALRSSSVLLGQIEGTLVGIRVVKAYNAERFERRRYSKILSTLVGEQVRMSRIDTISAPVMETLIMLMAGMVVLVGTYLITERNTLPAADFIAVMISLAVIAESLRRASKVNNALQKANAAAARLFETLDLTPERDLHHLPAHAAPVPAAAAPTNGAAGVPVASVPGASVPAAVHRLPPLRTAIDFQDIVFTYPNGSSPALNGVSLRVPRGQSVAVVGRNGSGKTTLLALLERFFDPDSGRILIDGVDIRTVARPSLRRQISLVTQDSHIFPGTIAENIAYGEPLASPLAADSPERREIFSRIEDAARRAYAHDFIMEKPGQYGMMMEGLGSQLSGGQKQRLCIARAIFHQAPILILDEATSQVDAESEHFIHQAIEQLIHERTTFVIAHRFSTILSADTIVVMERGRIVGQGKHEELLATCEIYQQLYERQLIGAAPARND